MSATTNLSTEDFASSFGHASCIMCGGASPLFLNLSFRPDLQGGVVTDLKLNDCLQGYNGLIHGGMAAALLDSAMTHCLFHRGVRAVTGDLNVRYFHPVCVDMDIELHAWVLRIRSPLFKMKAVIVEAGQIMISAQASFYENSLGIEQF